MKTKIILRAAFLITLVIPFSASAQSIKKDLQGIIEAERGFARTSREEGTRQAFLANLGKGSLLFTRGEIVDGIEKWNRIEADSALLNWWPVYADVSGAGDLGYTTGPFQFFKNRTDLLPVANGFYSTVWKKDSDGSWKVATDLGISTLTQLAPTDEVFSPKKSGLKVNYKKGLQEVQLLESEYTKLLNQSRVSFLLEYFAHEFRVHRQQHDPIVSLADLQQLNENHKFSFEPVGADIASSGDMAFTYGKVKIEIEKSDPLRIVPVNYVRVWKNFEGKWKIVLDVIGG